MSFISKLKDLSPLKFEASSEHKNCSTTDSTKVEPCAYSALNPQLNSADKSLLPVLDHLKSDTRNLTDEHGYAAGLINTQVDAAIGTGLTLCSKPNYQSLGVTQEQGQEWASLVENEFMLWADDHDKACNVQRRLNFKQMQRQVTGSYFSAGEALGVAEFLRSRRFRTSISIVDPDRLASPVIKYTEEKIPEIRKGVELSTIGEPTAYWIRTTHQNDLFEGRQVSIFDDRDHFKRIRRLTTFGRPNVFHIFDQKREGQTRGKPLLTPVIEQMGMLSEYKRESLKSAILQNNFALTITSEIPNSEIGDAMGIQDKAKELIKSKLEFYKGQSTPEFGGARITQLHPGEKIDAVFPTIPSQNFVAFETAILRDIAAGTNMSYEGLSKDYSRSNYSSTRAAMLEAWRNTMVVREIIADQFCKVVFRLWLEEAIAKGNVPLLGDKPFNDNITAYIQSDWNGPKRDHIDPLKETNADIAALDAGFTSLEVLCSERGTTWEKVVEQKERESLKQLESKARVIARAKEISEELEVPIQNLIEGAEAMPEEPEEENPNEVPGETDETDQNESTN